MLGRRSSRQADDRPRGLVPFLKRWTIPAIGAITPVGLIVVNIAAFITKHLAEFRWTITVAAFVSSMMLNSWMAMNVFRVLQRRRPDHSLVQDRNQELVLVGGVAVVILLSVLAALFCYWGLSDPNSLPNGATFFSGALAIALPIVLQGVFARGRATRAGGTVDARVTSGPRGNPSAAPVPAPPSPAAAPAPGPGTPGYTPPRYLPPS
jgi:chromate transport protein ChrA